MVVAAVFLFVIFAALTAGNPKLTGNYRAAAAKAYRDGDTKAAELWSRKVALLNPNDPATRFNLAVTAAENGNKQRASEIIRTLAPEDAAGHVPAHLWRVQELLRSFDPTNHEQCGLLRHHLAAVLQKERNNLVAREQLARLEMAIGDLDAATRESEQLVKADRAYSLQLAKLLVLQGEQAAANEVASRGIDHFQDRLQLDSGDVQSRIALARLEGFLERFDRSAKLLIDGVRRDPAPSADDMNQLRMELGDVYLGRARLLQRTQPDLVAERLESLQLALKFTPNHPRVLESIAELVRADSAKAGEAYEMLSSSLAEGTATPMVHLMLSIAAFERGEFELEQHHLELALAGDRSLVVAMNNLAWRLATSEPPELEKAFELIDNAVTQAPERPELRATRGRIHQLLGRNTKAIIDLEAALATLKDRPDINDALARLYDEIGDQQLAEQHRDRATQLRGDGGKR
jgi:tetratricopeptide (TPR) repeat protein